MPKAPKNVAPDNEDEIECASTCAGMLGFIGARDKQKIGEKKNKILEFRVVTLDFVRFLHIFNLFRDCLGLA